MTRAQILPSFIILISVAAGLVCASDGDLRRAAYWFAAAALTASVTF